jgi:hypothetical protein
MQLVQGRMISQAERGCHLVQMAQAVGLCRLWLVGTQAVLSVVVCMCFSPQDIMQSEGEVSSTSYENRMMNDMKDMSSGCRETAAWSSKYSASCYCYMLFRNTYYSRCQ